VSKGTWTYDNSHAGTLDHSAEQQHTSCNLPACGAPLHAAADNDDEGYQRAQLDDDSERDQESDGAPHIAKRRVFRAVAGPRERDARVFDYGTATMEAIGIFALAVLAWSVWTREVCRRVDVQDYS
jgi:hypothetical protein